MRPEMPYLAAGGIAIVGGIARAKGFPPNLLQASIGTVILVIVASATTNTKLAPLVHAVGLLLVLAATMGAVNAINASKRKGK